MRDRFTPGRLLLGGHRGNPADHPENTLASFDSAIALGVDVIGGGERIPELVEVLELARGKVGVAVEIKNLPVTYPGIEARLVEALRNARMSRECAAISFDHRSVKRVRELDQDVVGGVLVAGRPLMLAEMLSWADAQVYSPHWSFVDSETVAEVHGCGAVIGVWTVDDTDILERSRNLGVDAVYTNRPEEMLRLLAEA